MGIIGVMCCFCVLLFFSGGKLNEGVCMHYYDFHNLVEQSLGKTKSRGSTEKVRKTPSEEHTGFRGFRVQRKD